MDARDIELEVAPKMVVWVRRDCMVPQRRLDRALGEFGEIYGDPLTYSEAKAECERLNIEQPERYHEPHKRMSPDQVGDEAYWFPPSPDMRDYLAGRGAEYRWFALRVFEPVNVTVSFSLDEPAKRFDLGDVSVGSLAPAGSVEAAVKNGDDGDNVYYGRVKDDVAECSFGFMGAGMAYFRREGDRWRRVG